MDANFHNLKKSCGLFCKIIAVSLLISNSCYGYGRGKRSAIVIDYNANKIVVFNDHANDIRYPASLTKMMTAYLVFDAIKQKKINFNTKFKVSKLAAQQAPSKLGLHIGEKMTVLELIKALIVKSANDAAVVLAEGLCGSVKNFSRRMTDKARQLGMSKTNFENPSGLPNVKQITCAKDVATLGMAIFKNFPQHWHFFSLKSFSHRGQLINTHCKILKWCKGTDGGKTGFTHVSGFHLFVTAKKYNSSGDSKRLFVVVMGEDSSKTRDIHAASLLSKFFNGYTICTPVKEVSKKVKNKSDKKRDSLTKQITVSNHKNDNKKEDIVYEDEVFLVKDLLKDKGIKDDIDKLYAEEEDVLDTTDEIYVEQTGKSREVCY